MPQIIKSNKFNLIQVRHKMEQGTVTCNLCKKPNDQMLMLSCIHDPCLSCAAKAYAEQVHIKGKSKEVYICQVCNEETKLDSQTVTELSQLAKEVIKSPIKNITPSKISQSNKSVSPTKDESQQSSKSAKKPYFCKDHGQQQISYYCFSCLVNICPECAIHGKHKDHEVQLIKKAVAEIKVKYMQIVGKINNSQSSTNKLREGFLRLKKQSNDRYMQQKGMITREFDNIRAALAAKQKEFLRELDEINKQNISSFNKFIDTIQENTDQGNKLKKSIEATTKKDDVLILEEYRKINQFEQSLLNLNKITTSLQGKTFQMNVQFLQQQCKEVLGHIDQMKVNQKKQEGSNSSK